MNDIKRTKKTREDENESTDQPELHKIAIVDSNDTNTNNEDYVKII